MSQGFEAFTEEELKALEQYHEPTERIGYAPAMEIHRGLLIVASVNHDVEPTLSVYTIAQVKRALERARRFVQEEKEEAERDGDEFEEIDLVDALFETDGIREHGQ